jgi:hypothetical protein
MPFDTMVRRLIIVIVGVGIFAAAALAVAGSQDRLEGA